MRSSEIYVYLKPWILSSRKICPLLSLCAGTIIEPNLIICCSLYDMKYSMKSYLSVIVTLIIVAVGRCAMHYCIEFVGVGSRCKVSRPCYFIRTPIYGCRLLILKRVRHHDINISIYFFLVLSCFCITFKLSSKSKPK